MAQAPGTSTATRALVRITNDIASLAGVLAGDEVLLDTETAPHTGDLIAVRLDTGEVSCFRVHGPFLMPQAPVPLPALPIADADVLGVARQVWRELR